MDKHWIQHFISATYTATGWHHLDPDDLQAFQTTQVYQMLEQLEVQATLFAQACHEASRGKRTFRIVPAHSSIQGFTLLFARLQTKIQLEAQGITSNLLVLEGFTPKSLKRHAIIPTSDTFGGLNWCLDHSTQVTAEQFIKVLAEDMLKAAFETGDIRP